MANIRKSFNFRNGIQVDDDNFIINPNGLVGIGTTIPLETLDVRGDVRVTGFLTAANLLGQTLEISGATNLSATTAESIVAAGISIGAGIITASDPSGIVTFYGDGVNLQNIPTSQWIDIDVGLGFTSIYAQGFVGVGTVVPRFVFQVAGTPDTSLAGFSNGVGISSDGNVLITGITTSGTFVGVGSDIIDITADNIKYGSINLDRVPTIPDSKLDPNLNLGIVTTTELNSGFVTTTNLTVTETIAGVANTALGLSGDPDIEVGIATANVIVANESLVGIATTAYDLVSDAKIDIESVSATHAFVAGVTTIFSGFVDLVGTQVGLNTQFSFGGDFHIHNSFASNQILLTGDDGLQVERIIRFGKSQYLNSFQGHTGFIRHGFIGGLYPYSTSESVDFASDDSGNTNFYLDYSGIGVNTGGFHWIWGNQPAAPLMSLTYGGNLGIGVTDPEVALDVSGIATVSSNFFVQGTTSLNDAVSINNNVTVSAGNSITAQKIFVTDGANGLFDNDGTSLITGQNVSIASGISTFYNMNVTNQLYVDPPSPGTPQERAGIKIGLQSDGEPLAPFQVGSGLVDEAEDLVLIDEGSIGIGTTAIRDEIGLDCLDGDAIFRAVGIGTTDVEGETVLSVYGRITNHVDSTQVNATDPGCIFTGVTTSTGGFSSGVGGGVQITVVGNDLTFTVGGLSTSLTLS